MRALARLPRRFLPRRFASAGLAVFVAALGLAAPAYGQQGWSQPVVTISEPEVSTVWVGRGLAVDPAGNVFAIWPQSIGLDRTIQVARFTTASGLWGPPTDLSRPGYQANYPQIAADDVGNAIAVWQSWDGRDARTLAARFTVATGEWSTPTELSPEGQDSLTPVVAADGDGNALVMWSRQISAERFVLQSVRYSAATGTWGGVVEVPGSGSSNPGRVLRMNRAGSAFVAFGASDSVYVARYFMATNTWSGPVAISTPGQIAYLPYLAVDPAGNALAVFLRTGGIVQAARFVASTGSWTAPSDISLAGSSQPLVVVDGAGNATAAWQRFDRLEISRYRAGEDDWTSALAIWVNGGCCLMSLAADAAGNVLFGGAVPDATSGSRLWAGRLAAGTGTWTSTPDLSTAGQTCGHVQAAFDGGGSATLIWEQSVPSLGIRALQARRWNAAPMAPEIRSIGATSRSLTVDFAPPVTPEPAFSPVNYAYSIDDGETWVTPHPASTSSALLIGGLTDSVRYRVRVRAINAAGPGAPSAAAAAIAGPWADAPEGLTTTRMAGNLVTLSWTPPVAGVVPTGYVLEGGSRPGEVLASTFTGNTAPTFTFAAPTGAFYIRLYAVNGSVRSPASNEIRIFVNVPERPSAPANLLGLVNGSTIALSWTNTFAGGAPTSLWLNVTGAITTTLPLPMGEAFTYANVPPGTYTLSAVAANAGGVSAPSNAVTLTFPQPCSGVPEAPTGLQAWKVGSTIFLAWDAPVGGPAVTSYTVWVTGSWVGSFTVTGRTLSGAAAPGRYTIGVGANNPCGTGPATPAQTVVLP